jgi:hypothetical protein
MEIQTWETDLGKKTAMKLNIVFMLPVAFMFHLYTFTSVLNATLFTNTPLHKNRIKN